MPYKDKYRRREYSRRWSEAKRQERLRWARKHLGACCVVCGTVVNLEFDHVDPSTKCFVVTDRAACVSWSKFEAEVNKCQLLCAECHMEKTLVERRGETWEPPAPWDLLVNEEEDDLF